MPESATRSSTRGSSTARTPWPSRSGSMASSVASTAAGPKSLPACGTSARPACRAIRKAAANSAVSPRRSSLLSPNPTTEPAPSPAYCTASRASVRASRGWRMRLAATTTATEVCSSREAAAASSRTISSAGVMPPTNGAYDVGSTCSSSHRDPSAASSRAASRTIRRRSASSRTQARAASYRRWKRNQPRSSRALSRGGQPLVSASGSRMPCLAASSRTVSTRIDPVKCRCRWALGSVSTGRGMRCSVAPAATRRGADPLGSAPRCAARCRWMRYGSGRVLGSVAVDHVHGLLLGAEVAVPGAELLAEQLGLVVLPAALVGGRELSHRSVAHLGVTEEVLAGVDAVGVVAAHPGLRVEAALVVGCAVGRGGVGDLLHDALVDGLVLALLGCRGAPLGAAGLLIRGRPGLVVTLARVQQLLLAAAGVDGVVHAVAAEVVLDAFGSGLIAHAPTLRQGRGRRKARGPAFDPRAGATAPPPVAAAGGLRRSVPRQPAPRRRAAHRSRPHPSPR